MGGNDAPLDRLLQPGPLKHRRLKNRGRCIRVIFQKFRWPAPVKTEVEPAIEAGLVAVPALGDQRPECFRYLQAAKILFVVDRASDEFEAHGVDLAGGLLDLTFDLIQRERIIGALVPIALAIDGVEIESGAFGSGAPIAAFRACDTPHGTRSAHFRRQRANRRHGHGHGRARGTDPARHRSRHIARDNSRTTVHSLRAFARVRSRCAERNPSIRRRRLQYPSWSRSRGASVSWCGPLRCSVPEQAIVSHLEVAKQAKANRFTQSCGARPVHQPPPEKCAVKARANEPKPPRVTPPEPESDEVPDEVPDEEWLDEGSPP